MFPMWVQSMYMLLYMVYVYMYASLCMFLYVFILSEDVYICEWMLKVYEGNVLLFFSLTLQFIKCLYTELCSLLYYEK